MVQPIRAVSYGGHSGAEFSLCPPLSGSLHRPRNKLLEALEQIGRFGFMIIQLPGAVWGFWFPGAQEVYFAYGMVITALYCLIWALCFHRPSLFRALALSILPSLLFLGSGFLLCSLPLILSALLFAPCHIFISVRSVLDQ